MVSIIVVNIVVMVLSAQSLGHSRQQHELRSQTLTQNIAVALNQNVSNRIQKIDLALQTMVDELERQLGDKGLDNASVTAMLSRHEQRLPEAEAIRVADKVGLVILGKGVNPKEPASWADRDYFTYLREHADGGLQISKPRLGRVAKQYIIGFARRYNYPDGRFAGVISAPIAVEQFTQLLSQFDIGPHGTLILRDSDHGLITRLPALAGQAVGTVGNADVSKEFKNLAQSGVRTSTYHLKNSPDGFERILTFRRMEGAPMTVIVGSGSNDYLENWYQECYRALGMVVGFLFLSGLMGTFLLRLLAQLAKDQAQLKESENRLRAIIENEPECIKIIDEHCKLRQINPAGLKMVEATSAEQVIGQSVEPLISAEYREAFSNMHRRVIAGESIQMEFEIQGLQGTRRILETHAVPMLDHGAVVHLAVTRDISERKAYENKLKHAKKAAEAASIAKSRFLATMSHEIRTPMNGILGMAQLLLMPDLKDDERRDYAGTIYSSGQALLSLLNDILDLSKIEAGKFELDTVDFDPVHLLSGIDILFSGASQTKHLQLVHQWRGRPNQRYRADAHRLRQMISNLVGNAIKFSTQGSIHLDGAEIERKAEKALLEFSVTDNGIGIPEDKRDLLFKPFSQTESSITREFGGSGLGLSIVSQLAKLMGGEVGVKSVLGQGSRFWFRVWVNCAPDAEDVGQHKPGTEDQSNSPSHTDQLSGRVLVVEDNMVNRMVIESLLVKLGVTVTLLNDGQQAVDAITHGDQKPDIILMDLHMPVMDGYTAVTQIRQWEADQQRTHLPIIALTADAFEEDRQHCLAVGMNDFLTKPVELNVLKSTLSKWLSVMV
jgi:PAS domain S-box-containing protein